MTKANNFGILDKSKPIEFVVNQDYNHVVLLIDSSGSMMFPFLKDESNYNKETSEDYQCAIKLSQEAMIAAHAKALKALRGSAICNDCFLLITQYTFNSSKHKLNEAEELARSGLDKVVKISEQNYRPYNGTALYNTIHEALLLIYENHLKEAYEIHKRVDKISIGVITDGEDTVLTDDFLKRKKIEEIKNIMAVLRGKGSARHLDRSVLIGLTSKDFTESKLKEVAAELTFDTPISIDSSDEKAIRKAFDLWSKEAARN